MLFSATNLAFQHKGFSLGPIDLNLEQGVVNAVIGPNGSGKTTLISSIVGALPATGEMRFQGQIIDHSKNCGWKREIGVITDEPKFWSGLSCQQNLDFFAPFFNRWDKQLLRKLTESFSLDLRKKADQLSKGERRKLAAICALSSRPKFLILDEATAGVDLVAHREFTNIILDHLARTDLGILLVSHDVSDIGDFTDIFLPMNKGKLLPAFSKEAISDGLHKVTLQGQPPLPSAFVLESLAIGSQTVVWTDNLAMIQKSLPPEVILSVQLPTLKEALYFRLKGM